MRELRKMGRLALTCLEPAITNHPDPEVRFRCELLLPAATTDDFTARKAAFIADTQGRYDHELPGWEEFRQITGSDRPARELFTQMLESEGNRAVLASMNRPHRQLAAQLAARMAELHTRMYPRFLPAGAKRYTPTAEDAATVILAEVLLGADVQPVRGVAAANLVSHTAFRKAIAEERLRPALERLTIRWLDSRTDPSGLLSAMNIANTLKLAETPRYIERVLRSPQQHAANKAAAAMLLARRGEVEHIPKLASLFDDETVVRRNPNQEDIQLRDAGLSLSMVLAGKNPADIGFLVQSPAANRKFHYWNYRFPSDEARKKAFAQWKVIQKELDQK
jgi:hypothetical protein